MAPKLNRSRQTKGGLSRPTRASSSGRDHRLASPHQVLDVTGHGGGPASGFEEGTTEPRWQAGSQITG